MYQFHVQKAWKLMLRTKYFPELSDLLHHKLRENLREWVYLLIS